MQEEAEMNIPPARFPSYFLIIAFLFGAFGLCLCANLKHIS